MTWGRALRGWLVFLLLLGIQQAGRSRLPAKREAEQPVAVRSLIDTPAERIRHLVVRTSHGAIVAELRAGGWTTLPPARPVPSDLIPTLLQRLATPREVAIVGVGTAYDPGFGLGPKGIHIEWRDGDGHRGRLRLGARNPGGTAVYGQVAGEPRVLLVGLDVAQQLELLLDARPGH